MKIFASISAHEAEMCLIDQCLNYICVGEFDGVVIHLNATNEMDIPVLQLLIDEIGELKGKVHLNPVRLQLHGMKRHPQLTPILHRAHVENYLYLQKLEQVDVFCLDASNCLLVKKGLRNYVRGGVGVYQWLPSRGWRWKNIVTRDAALHEFRPFLRISQHEGTFFDNATFGKICQFILKYDQAIARAFPDEANAPEYTKEEVLFSTGYAAQATGKPSPLQPYIWFRWETDLEWPRADVIDVLNHPDLPVGKYGIKRIPRQINDPSRVEIGNYFGYRPILVAACERIDASGKYGRPLVTSPDGLWNGNTAPVKKTTLQKLGLSRLLKLIRSISRK